MQKNISILFISIVFTLFDAFIYRLPIGEIVILFLSSISIAFIFFSKSYSNAMKHIGGDKISVPMPFKTRMLFSVVIAIVSILILMATTLQDSNAMLFFKFFLQFGLTMFITSPWVFNKITLIKK